jgi:hypothetical protein
VNQANSRKPKAGPDPDGPKGPVTDRQRAFLRIPGTIHASWWRDQLYQFEYKNLRIRYVPYTGPINIEHPWDRDVTWLYGWFSVEDLVALQLLGVRIVAFF